MMTTGILTLLTLFLLFYRFFIVDLSPLRLMLYKRKYSENMKLLRQ